MTEKDPVFGRVDGFQTDSKGRTYSPPAKPAVVLPVGSRALSEGDEIRGTPRPIRAASESSFRYSIVYPSEKKTVRKENCIFLGKTPLTNLLLSAFAFQFSCGNCCFTVLRINSRAFSVAACRICRRSP